MITKFAYHRSKPLLQACRAIPCQHCGSDDGTVCAAHSNQAQHGKGKSIKASDQYVASLCFRCHSALDQGSRLSRDERVEMWTAAHRKTVRLLLSLGQWPAAVPVPDIRRFH